MTGAAAVSHQAPAQYAQVTKDVRNDGDADDQTIIAQASAKADREQQAIAAAANPKGVGGNIDITA